MTADAGPGEAGYRAVVERARLLQSGGERAEAGAGHDGAGVRALEPGLAQGGECRPAHAGSPAAGVCHRVSGPKEAGSSASRVWRARIPSGPAA